MKKYSKLYIASMVVLGIILILVIWQPVFPSGVLIGLMADQIDPQQVSLERSVTVRFDLSGKGGGRYNILVNKDSVKTKKGDTDAVDLVIYMEAADFNNLMYSIASGKADESMFVSLGMSDILRVAGDISILENLFRQED